MRAAHCVAGPTGRSRPPQSVAAKDVARSFDGTTPLSNRHFAPTGDFPFRGPTDGTADEQSAHRRCAVTLFLPLSS